MGVWKAAAIALCAAAGPAHAWAPVPLEQQVLAVLNAARADPQAYVRSLRAFRGCFQHTTYRLPGSPQAVATWEGVAAVDDTIAFLDRQAPLAPLVPAGSLTRSAGALAADQARSGRLGHWGSDGSSPDDRARAAGDGGAVSEVIAYGPVDAVDVVRQLIVDDGVTDRGHREILFSPGLRFAGVACGPHLVFGTMCVVDLAPAVPGSPARPVRIARFDPPHAPLRR